MGETGRATILAVAVDTADDANSFLVWQERVRGANISPQTLLATDYLNHFNEITMLIDMVPDMPELLDECRGWQPRGYQDHFRTSTFSERDLAVAAYDHVPEQFRVPFEETIQQMNSIVQRGIERIDEAIALNEPDLVRVRAHATGQALRRLNEVASGIIHGANKAMDQDEIDHLLGF